MPQKSKREHHDEDFTFQRAPKRSNYRRVSHKTKKELVTLYLSKNLKISEVAKRYHLSYATVAHIIKTISVVQQEVIIKKEVQSEPVKEQFEFVREESKQVKEEISESLILALPVMENRVERRPLFPFFYPFGPYPFFYPLTQ